ncbi:helix-turn-helix transcriptional regulator [Nocardia grenadensis]
MTTKPRPLATAAEVAEYRQTTVEALAQERYRGEGPAYHRLGRAIRYDWAEVEAWVKANTVRTARVA